MATGTPSAPRREHQWIRPTGAVDDPYAWLNDKNDPQVLTYLTEENIFTDGWFAQRDATVEAIFGEIRSRVNEDDSSYPLAHRGWWYASRTEAGKSYAIHSRGRTAGGANESVLLDENTEADGHDYFALSAFDVSNDGNLLAWSSDTDGSEMYTLRVRDLTTGSELADEIPDTAWGGTAWSADDEWIFYVTPDEAMRPWRVWRHRIGTPATDDVMVLEEPDERFFVGVGASRSGDWIVLESASKTSSECWVVPATDPTASPVSVAPRREGVEYQVDHWGDVFVIHTNLDAEDFRVMTAPVSAPAEWSPFIGHEPGNRIAAFECFDGFAVMSRWTGGQQVLSIVDRNGASRTVHVMDEPHEVEIDSNPDFATASVRIAYQSLTVPPTTASVDRGSLAITVLKRTEVPGCDLSQYTAERLWATAADGTLVPVDIVRRRDTPTDGSAPALVYAYGSYEISTPPWFSVGRLSLLDRGWVWALAHPRGGGEMGRRWYTAGKFLNKRNTFTDVVACATHLADNGICDGARMVVRGGSAGGLMVGACITMEPSRFAGAIAEVPFVDVVTTMSDPSMPLTVTEWEEWGDPRTEPFASYIASYSPYDNVRPLRYPDLYVTAGLNDPRVSYHEPAKFVARIRHDSPDTHVLFKCEMGAGHGGPSGRYDQWRDEARTLTFAIESVTKD